MAERRPNPWRRFLARPNTDPVKSVGIAALVAATCGLAVSVTAVVLRPIQQENRLAARAGQMTAMLEGVPGIAELLPRGGVETFVVDLAEGRISDTDPVDFDQDAAAADPGRSTALPPAADLAAIGRRENESLVWMVREGDRPVLVILPVRGAGYQSTIRAYLALEGDLNTVAAFTVYDQAETPGLGSRVADPAFGAGWVGKRIADDSGIAIDITPGAQGPHEVEAISGASVTGYGAIDMVHFWMGPEGFGPFLENLREGTAWR
ncbi:FMN-binding protein [Paenirhodobacter populi]|uniref:FMN-binding protein n=1 Tax=Paenirhodobacter populi TaxID=2306993 RepID=UPI000FE3289B|nr:FMN-binding protein [Sinirhodobacter populi]RWR04212.1 FMN-binding protein [Sinirhodobacter populi]